MLHTYTIVPLEKEDAAELASLEALCFPTPWSESQYRQLLEHGECAANDSGSRTLAFGSRSADGELAGYVCLGLHSAIQELEIYNIAVRATHRQRGLGKTLLAHALEDARQRGVARALLEVRPSNAAALALYASLGFAVCGSRRNYYADSGEDALILTNDLAL